MVMYRRKQPPISAWKFKASDFLNRSAPTWVDVKIWASGKGGVYISELRYTIDGVTEICNDEWIVYDGIKQTKYSEADFKNLFEVDTAPKPIEKTLSEIVDKNAENL